MSSYWEVGTESVNVIFRLILCLKQLNKTYEIIYQLDAIEYLFVYYQLDMFRAYMPIFRSNGCYSFFTYVAYGVLGLVWLGVGPEGSVCAGGVLQDATRTHTPQDYPQFSNTTTILLTW